MQTDSPGVAAMIVRLLQTEGPRWGCINNEVGATSISVLNKPKRVRQGFELRCMQ